MPTYEYRCESCGNQYEKRESFSAPPRQKCPRCGKTVTRILHAPPIVFKGSGFYKTDSRDGKPKREAEPTAPPGDSSASSTDSETTETAAAT